MNEVVKNALWILAGVALGATGASLMSRHEMSLRGAVVGTLAQGMSVKDKVVTTLEKAKENVEDIVAEARHVQTGKSRPTEESGKTSS
jgi:exonuclease VII small subunit